MKAKPKRGTAEVEALRAIKDRDQASHEELARLIGVSMAAVYGWLARGRTPGPMALKALRRFLARDERRQAE
jgi:DNA-binding transcriptional regulator YiaG